MRPVQSVALALALASASLGETAPAVAFAPDAETLFLAHYDHGLDADVSAGEPYAEGNAALLPDAAPNGSGAVLLKRGLTLSPEGVRLPFQCLTYDLLGNLDTASGTLEFWFRPDFSERKPDRDYYLHYIFDARRGSTDGVVLMLTATTEGQRTLLFNERAPGTDTDRGLSYNASDWTPGAWHHLAVTWQGSSRALWVDGHKVGAREDAPDGLAVSGEVFRLGSVRWSDHYADGALDEFRISRVVRYAD